MEVFLEKILSLYGQLLTSVDVWFDRCLAEYPEEIACKTGCSACCRSLFDITLLDAYYLNTGFRRLDEEIRRKVKEKAEQRLLSIREKLPDFSSPFVLNSYPEEAWGEVIAKDDQIPCVLLDDEGRCLIYDHRPMTCRLHGLPLIDVTGEIFDDTSCTSNFVGSDPFALGGLQFEFKELFRDESTCFQLFTSQLLKQSFNELDGLIPTALLLDFERFDWQAWLKCQMRSQALKKDESPVS